MNYADFGLGTWYPHGGMKAVVDGIIMLARSLGVEFHTNSTVSSINVAKSGVARSITINGKRKAVEILVSGADYWHTEMLLPEPQRVYSSRYWQKRVMAPSALLFFVGFSKKIDNVLHHTLFFDSSFDQHAIEIYDNPTWPENPLFYASFPSKTDNTVAPNGMEAAVFLIPIANDLEDNEKIREYYFEKILKRLEELTRQDLRAHVRFKKSYCIQDFKDDYNSYRGNAYGLANTLKQTAFLRPKLSSKKVKNLYFTGQLSVPGPGVPPALISGKLVSQLIHQKYSS